MRGDQGATMRGDHGATMRGDHGATMGGDHGGRPWGDHLEVTRKIVECEIVQTLACIECKKRDVKRRMKKQEQKDSRRLKEEEALLWGDHGGDHDFSL